MSAQITVTLPDEVFQRANLLARLMGRPVHEVLAETIEVSLRPLGTGSNGENSITDGSDEEVMAAADGDMAPADDQHLSNLLHRQQAGVLTPAERSELTALMERHQRGLLRKAQALREAVRRGLREPLQP